jgi:hypothetical protein
MYREAGARHHTAHFHAYYQEDAAILALSQLKWRVVSYRTDNVALSKPGPSFTNKSF